MPALETYGKIIAPWTVSWTDEDGYWVAPDPLFGGAPALHQSSVTPAQRSGKPRFQNPHFNRQREAMVKGLCDLCARPLKGHTRYSLSRSSLADHVAAAGLSGGQELYHEPMLHRVCAQTCLDLCPALRGQIADGTVRIRRVTRCETVPERLTAQQINRLVPDYRGPPAIAVVGLRILESCPVALDATT